MSDTPIDWTQTFSDLFHSAVKSYHEGHQKASGLVDEQGHAFLTSIGYTEQEFFDFVEDFAKAGEPTLETALNIASVRRDYFLREQKGIFSTRRISMSDLPSKEAQVEGIAWLPRLLPKAEAKLRGEMPADLMYGCGGDRRFFRTNEIDPAEFLRKVWLSQGDPSGVIAWVKAKAASLAAK
jgi:Domain of unknown function (DUF5069)